MERPTSALHLTRVTLDLRELNAEPHTKEVGHVRVYSDHCVRSARGLGDGGGALPGHRTPAVHQLQSGFARRSAGSSRGWDERVCGVVTKPGRAASSSSAFWPPARSSCDVIAPALIPRRPGDRIKTDRRDAGQLGGALSRRARLTAVHVPTEQEEAARDLLRCREDIRADLLRARHRLSKFLLRHGRRFTGTKKAWSKRHDVVAARADVAAPRTRPDAPGLSPHGRRSRGPPPHASRRELRDLLTLEPLQVARPAPAVFPRHRRSHGADDRRRARRPAALSDGAEHDGVCRAGALGALERDANAREAPSPRRAMPICGACSLKPPGTIAIIPSSAGRSGAANRAHRTRSWARAWAAQQRLHHRYRRLAGRGKPKQHVVTAVARELTGFVWDVLTRVI